MLKLEIPSDIFERMLEQARAEAPIEACGILAGSDGRVEKWSHLAGFAVFLVIGLVLLSREKR